MDNNLTPHLEIDATIAMVRVPRQYVRNGRIVLNIAPEAVVAFVIEKDAISFNARFHGKPFQVYIPMTAVLGIHAGENGAGTFFSTESDSVDLTWQVSPVRKRSILEDSFRQKQPRPEGPPTLRIVK